MRGALHTSVVRGVLRATHLQLVHLESQHEVDEPIQRPLGGNFIPRHIQHVTTVRHARPVVYGQWREADRATARCVRE